MARAKPKHTNVPKLRFPKFGGPWNKIKLKGVSTIYDGTHQTPIYVSKGVPFFSVEHVTADNFDDTKFISEEVYEKEKVRVIPEKNDILMTRIGDIGTAKLLNWNVKASFYVSLALIKVNQQNSPAYIAAYIPTTMFQRELWHRTIHVAFPKKINLGEIGECIIKLPEITEQAKIAAFFEAVDERLKSLRKKRELLDSYKRGVMQKLFLQTLRFTRDENSAFPDWEEKKFSDVFDWIKTNSLSREHLTYERKQIQNIHYGDIHKKYKPNFRQDSEIVPFISSPVFTSNLSEDEFCKLGDLIIADASEDYADIGKAIEIVDVKPNSLVAGLHTYIARPKDGDTVLGFSGYLFRSAAMRKQIMRIAQGISVLGISKTNIEKLIFWLPHADEQAKMANFLTALDAKIDEVKEQATKTEAFKKGLLQQMFV